MSELREWLAEQQAFVLGWGAEVLTELFELGTGLGPSAWLPGTVLRTVERDCAPDLPATRRHIMLSPNPALESYLDELRARFDKASVEYKQKYVRDTFDSFDADGSGAIDPDEFRRLCKRISPTMSDEDVEEALEVIDEDGDGEITFAEFEVWWNGDYASELREAHEQMLGSSEMDEVEMVERWEGKKRDLEEAKLRRTFDGVDEDGSGEIEEPEFRRLCRRLDARLEDEVVSRAWAQLDEDGSGAADFREFEAWWKSSNGRELRGVKAEDYPRWSYNELLAAVQRRVDARAQAALAEKEARKLRLAADKQARVERRAAKAAAIQAAQRKAEEQAAMAAQLAEEEWMQSSGYLKEMAQAALDEEQRQMDEERRQRLLGGSGSEVVKRSSLSSACVLPKIEPRGDVERRWRAQLQYQKTRHRQHVGSLPEVNVRGARTCGMSPSTPAENELGVSTIAEDNKRRSAQWSHHRDVERARAIGTAKQNQTESILRRTRRANRRAADKRAAAKLRMSATANTVHCPFPPDRSAVYAVGTETRGNREPNPARAAGPMESDTSGDMDLLAGTHSSSSELATTCSDLFIANKDATKSAVLSAPIVGRRKRVKAQDKTLTDTAADAGAGSGKLRSDWMRRSGRLSIVRRIAEEQLMMDIAAAEKQKRIVYALDTMSATDSGTGQVRDVTTQVNQPSTKAKMRIRKRHDHPSRARYPLIGAVLRA